MAPSAEAKDGGVCVEDSTSSEDQEHEQFINTTPKRNVAFAVNYELSMVDQFTASERKRRGSSAFYADAVPEPTGDPTTSWIRSSPKTVPSALPPDVSATNRGVVFQTPPLEETTSNHNKRRSVRERKKEMVMSRARVRYDMQLVPVVKRNRKFLDSYSLPCPNVAALESSSVAPAEVPRRSSRFTTTKTDPIQPNPIPSSSQDAAQLQAPPLPCSYSSSGGLPNSSDSPSFLTSEPPFVDNETVLWVPTKRSDWEDSVSEMTAVCTSAAIRRFLLRSATTTSTKKGQQPVFYPPLSRDYIRDRVDIDDPLHGYQLRHRAGGWLQGFILWTTFTTWTHDFEWNSLHPKSGIVDAPAGSSSDQPSAVVDADGSLAVELQSQARSGNPHENGIVFDNVAEIALVGGLGCGEYLLRMALDSIVASPQKYRYVVLQATEQSKAFYERFGFVRVGAICRYGLPPQQQQAQEVQGVQPSPVEDNPLEGYRHWTHANESETSLQKHGGPSYMMCLRLPVVEAEGDASLTVKTPSFLEHMLSVAVQQKPTIEQLGGSFTPGPKILRRQSSNAGESVSAYIGSVSKKKPGRRGSGSVVRASTKRLHLSPPSGSFEPSNALGGSALTEPDAKRRKTDPLPDPVSSREKLSVPCKENDALTTPLGAKPEAGHRRPRLASSTNTSTSKTKTPASQSRRKKVPSVERGAVQSDDAKPRFYSVRGTDGRFVTLPFPPPAPSSSAPLPNKPTVHTPEKATPDISTSGLVKPLAITSPINRTELVKQKVKSYPRSRVHYFNRVVKSKISSTSSSSSNPTYYFVLNYDEAANTLCLVPMAPRGRLSGKNEGRPRYQAVLDGTTSNFLFNVVATNYQVVPATMIMKTPVVANEAWDVHDV